MAAKKQYLQMSFEGGMLERVSQETDYSEYNLKFQAPQSRSVMYLENFDHTIVAKSLTKRKGHGLWRTTEWNIDAGLVSSTGVPSGFDQNEVITCDIERFTELIDNDPGADLTDKATILGAMNVPYNRPVGQNIVLSFIREIDVADNNRERTRLVSYSRNTPAESLAWRNPQTNGKNSATGSVRTTTDPAHYPGWDVTGTLADASRFGGTVIFSTDVATELWPNTSFGWAASWVDDMYPCYTWTYWDLRRKRDDNKFWNLIGDGAAVTVLADLTSNYTTDSKYSQFKVLTPSHYIDRSDLVDFQDYYTAFTLNDSDALSTGDAGGLSWLSSVPAKAIEVAILEAPARLYNNTRQSDPDTERLTPTSKWVYAKEERQHLATLETLKVDVLYGLISPLDKYAQHINDGPRNNVFDGTFSGWTVTEGIIEYAGDNPRSAQVILAEDYYIRTLDNNEPDDDEYYDALIGVELPDYQANGTPRSWIKGEKIPLICTLKLRGTEVIAGRHVHQIGRDVQAPNLSMFSGYRGDITNGTDEVSTEYNNYGTGIGIVHHPSARGAWDDIREDGQLTFNGKRFVNVQNHGWYYNDGPSDANRKYKLYKSNHSYNYEPFNPTQNYPHTPDVNDGYSQEIYARPYGRDDDDVTNWYDANAAGFRRHHPAGNYVYINIKIRKDAVDDLLEMGLEAINVYCAEAGDESIFRSKGTLSVQDPDFGVFMFPATEDTEDPSQFRLIKSFLVDGDGDPFEDATEYTRWADRYKGQPVATNAWMEKTDHLVAVGQNLNGDASVLITPDFALWDYPTTSSRLSINSSGDYWQGRGAKVVAVIKGRTFLAGCIDQYGEEEQGKIRYSDEQAGRISLDLFSEENFLTLGGNPHTAMVEFREQLWTFSRQEVYRMQMPSITDITTWEYLDKYPSQGTYSPKTVTTTPFGVLWANESGVWLSDGRIPQNIAQPVLTLYQAMATNQPPYYATKFSIPEFPYDDFGTNPYLEISYDEESNELVVSSPTMDTATSGSNGANPDIQTPVEEYRLVFDFETNTWRAESQDHPDFATALNEFDRDGDEIF